MAVRAPASRTSKRFLSLQSAIPDGDKTYEDPEVFSRSLYLNKETAQMQIPQNIVSKLSAKGKGYVEAAMKLAEGYRLVEEATLEIAALDGKKLNSKREPVFQTGGGSIVTPMVRELGRPKITPDFLKSFLKHGPLSTREIAVQAGCSMKHARDVLIGDGEARVVGSGNQVKWSLEPKKTKALRKTKTAGKAKKLAVKRGKAGKSATARKQANCEAADPDQQKKDEEKILKILKEKPGSSIGSLMKVLKRSFYPVKRATDNLVKTGVMRPIRVPRDTGGHTPSWEIV